MASAQAQTQAKEKNTVPASGQFMSSPVDLRRCRI
jgi:hypothetical protein